MIEQHVQGFGLSTIVSNFHSANLNNFMESKCCFVGNPVLVLVVFVVILVMKYPHD